MIEKSKRYIITKPNITFTAGTRIWLDSSGDLISDNPNDKSADWVESSNIEKSLIGAEYKIDEEYEKDKLYYSYKSDILKNQNTSIAEQNNRMIKTSELSRTIAI